MEHFKDSLIFVSKFSEKTFGLTIPEHYIEWTLYIAGICILIRLTYTFMRPGLVRVGLVSALTDEQAVLAEDVADKVAKDFDDKLGKAIGEIQSALELQPSNQVALMASIVSLIEKSSKETISLQPAGEELGEPGPAGRELGSRAQMLLMLKDVVLSKHLAGNWFHEDEKERHIYLFEKYYPNNINLYVRLRTPYYDRTSSKSELPYGLEVWYRNQKQLNMEWMEGGEMKVRSIRRGEWEDRILSWSETSGSKTRRKSARTAQEKIRKTA